jgi:hypothetical protein
MPVEVRSSEGLGLTSPRARSAVQEALNLVDDGRSCRNVAEDFVEQLHSRDFGHDKRSSVDDSIDHERVEQVWRPANGSDQLVFIVVCGFQAMEDAPEDTETVFIREALEYLE